MPRTPKQLDLTRFNGTIKIELMGKLKEIAQIEGRSLNSLLNVILKEYCNNYDKEKD